MLIEFPCETFPGEFDEHDLQPRRPCELHCRQAVGITGNQDYPIYGLLYGVGGYVQAEPHKGNPSWRTTRGSGTNARLRAYRICEPTLCEDRGSRQWVVLGLDSDVVLVWLVIGVAIA